MGPEAKVVKRIREWVKKAGGVSVKVSGSELLAGIPDLVVVLPRWEGGQAATVFIEVKLPGEHPTKLQAAMIDKINSHGGRAFVAHSVDEVAGELGTRGTLCCEP